MNTLKDIYHFENELSKNFDAWYIYNDYAIVQSGKKWGIVNRQMEWLIKDYEGLRKLCDNSPLITCQKDSRFIDLKDSKTGIYDFFIAKKITNGE